MKKFIVVFCDEEVIYKVGNKSEVYNSLEEAQEAMKKDFFTYVKNFHDYEYDIINTDIKKGIRGGCGWGVYYTSAFISEECSCTNWKIIELQV